MYGERSGAKSLPCITQVGATHWWCLTFLFPLITV
uniref:Uncharacterized protein n=1 Tax=Anguilla anguilla TaxID=7936 RepID=A0A0E9USA6_ANGAN